MRNTEIVKLIIQHLWDDQAEVTLSNYIADDASIESPVDKYLPKTHTSVEKMKAIAAYWRKAFPDIASEEISLEEISPGIVVKKWKAYGIHAGSDFCNISQSNRGVCYGGETTYKITDDKLVGYEAIVDIEDIKNQLVASSPSS